MEDSKLKIHYGEKVLEYALPQGWNLLGNLRTRGLPPIGREEMMEAIKNPNGTPPLEELARGKKNAVLITCDITRPARWEVALPLVLDTLNRAGIDDDRILLIMGGGSHLPPKDFREACIKKYGEVVTDRVKIQYHNSDQDLVSLGKTKRGHSIEINKWVVEADLKIAFGGIIPHGMAGYSGGAKNILPGVSSRETIIQNHVMIIEPGAGMGLVEGNPIREEMEEVAEQLGLDFIFDLVLNAEGKPIGAAAGDVRKAHRQGVALAKQVFQTEIPEPAQVVFTSGHPHDIHLYQSFKGPGSVLTACQDGATIIHLTPAYEGVRDGTKKLFATVNALGYKNIFAKLKAGERQDPSVRNFMYPEINIGGAMNIFRAMVDRKVRIMIVTQGVPAQTVKEMGFDYASNLDEAVSIVHQRLPQANVIAAFNSKVVISSNGAR